MSALDNMRKRLNYSGGANQQSRMIADKLRSLKKALLYAYQSGTLTVDNPNYNKDAEEGSIESLPKLEFRCLMNPDKITFDTDKKMLSVPFKDICLNTERVGTTTEGIVDIPVKCGTVFKYTWNKTETYWIVTLQYLDELAYFRADTRKCFPHPLVINDKPYKFASIGENQETIEWLRKNREVYNKLNYTRTLYLERNSDTLDYFNRFKIIKVPNIEGELESWEVQAVNPNAIDDILIVHLKEYFENQFEEVSQAEQAKIQENNDLNEDITIYAYDTFTYGSPYVEGAAWEVKDFTDGLNFKLTAFKQDSDSFVTIQLLTGRAGEFDLYYNDVLQRHFVVKSI